MNRIPLIIAFASAPLLAGCGSGNAHQEYLNYKQMYEEEKKGLEEWEAGREKDIAELEATLANPDDHTPTELHNAKVLLKDYESTYLVDQKRERVDTLKQKMLDAKQRASQ